MSDDSRTTALTGDVAEAAPDWAPEVKSESINEKRRPRFGSLEPRTRRTRTFALLSGLSGPVFKGGSCNFAATVPPDNALARIARQLPLDLGRSLPSDPAEDAVDETAGVGGRVLLGKVHRLVDRHRRRNVEVDQLQDAEAQQRAVDGGHPGQRPVLGVAGDELVNLGLVRTHSLDEGGGIGERGIVRMAVEDLAGWLARNVVLVQRLQGDPAGAPPLGHVYPGGGDVMSGRGA